MFKFLTIWFLLFATIQPMEPLAQTKTHEFVTQKAEKTVQKHIIKPTTTVFHIIMTGIYLFIIVAIIIIGIYLIGHG